MKIFTHLDDIQDRDNPYIGIIANSLISASGALWHRTEQEISAVTFSIDVNGLEISRVLDDACAGALQGLPTRNLAKETLIKQIENLPSSPDCYEEGEAPPDQDTKNDAKQLILGTFPSGLLAGADVYSHYGEVNICWQTQRKKVKLIVPPHEGGDPLSIYHGQINLGRVTESKVEPNATPRELRQWLQWLQG